MSNYDFMKDAKSFIDAKVETFLKKNKIDESLSDIKGSLNWREPIFGNNEDTANEVTANEADYTEAYINKLMTIIINKISKKNETTFSEEYDNFRMHYLQE